MGRTGGGEGEECLQVDLQQEGAENNDDDVKREDVCDAQREAEDHRQHSEPAMRHLSRQYLHVVFSTAFKGRAPGPDPSPQPHDPSAAHSLVCGPPSHGRTAPSTKPTCSTPTGRPAVCIGRGEGKGWGGGDGIIARAHHCP